MTRALANLILWCDKNEFIMNEQDKFVDEYNTAKASTILNLMCKKNNHSFSITHGTWTNSKNRFKTELWKVCSCCINKILFEEKIKEILDKNGHQVISSYEDEKVEYLCGNCGRSNIISDIKILSRSNRGYNCVRCGNDNNRILYEDLVFELEKFNIVCLTKKNEYKDNKNILVECVCGNEWKTSLSDVKRGRNCGKCKFEKTINTNITRYGCENVFQNADIKKKIVEKCKEKHGVSHHRKIDKIQKQGENTTMQRYGVKWGFTGEWVYKKIRKFNIEKYGVEYPFLSSVYIGEFRKKMMEKYGAEHSMQCPELFRKASASLFKRKEYVFENGKSCMVLGYENICLQEIEDKNKEVDIYAGEHIEIPHFKYTTLDNKNHVYYPDIYIPIQNRIIEVKSVWTYNLDINKILYKARAVSIDYIFELWIYDSNKKLVSLTLMKNNEIILNTNTKFTLGILFENI